MPPSDPAPAAAADSSSPGSASRWNSWAWPYALLALAIVAVALSAVAFGRSAQHDREAVRLQAIANVQAEQVGLWLAERMAQAGFLKSTAALGEQYTRWHDAGDTASRDQLLQRLAEYGQAYRLRSVLLIDERGRVLSGDDADAAGAGEPMLRAAVQRAVASGIEQTSGLYFDTVAGAGNGAALLPRLDIVAPLAATGQPARAAIVLRLDPRAFLFPKLLAWPLPSATAETMLFRRDGDNVLILSDPRHAGPGLVRRLPLAAPYAVVTRVMRRDEPAGLAIDAVDYRGMPVLGVAREVPGTDWMLVAKMDRDEVYAPLAASLPWIVAAAALALCATGAGAYLHRARRALRVARRQQADQTHRLRSLQLLDAMAAGSTDVIFAKDRQGRYTLFNAAASRATGIAAEQVLGRDDRELFPAAEAEQVLANDRRVMDEDRAQTVEEDLTTTDGAVTYLATKGPLHDAAGNVVGLFGISRDITERRRVEAVLRASQSRLALALDAAGMGVWERDLRSGAAYWSSQSMALLTGRPDAGESTVFTFDALAHRLHPHDRDLVLADAQAATVSGRTFSAEFRIVRDDGTLRWASALARTEHDAGGAALRQVGTLQDVTERRRVEAELREAARFVQAVEDSVLDQMAVLDRDGTVVAVNAAWHDFALAGGARLASRSARANVGDDYLAVCRETAAGADGGAEAVRDGLRAVLAGTRDRYALEYAWGPADAERWFQMNATPLKTGRGGAVVVHAEVTERKQAEAALRRSEESYRSMTAALSEGVIVFDAGRRPLTWNPSAERILGPTLAEMGEEGRGFATWPRVRTDGEPYPADELPLARTLATGEAQHDVVVGRVDPRSGAILWLRLNVQPIIDAASGRPSGAVVSFTDVTARHADEQTLNRLSLVVEQSPNSIVVVDRGNVIEHVNRAFETHTGWRADEVIGQSGSMLRSERTPAAVYEEMWRALARGDNWCGEMVNQRKNGDERDERVLATPIRRPDGRVDSYLFIKEDVTETKRIEAELASHRGRLEELVAERTAELKQAERRLRAANDELTEARNRAEAATRAKSAFLANMSHEIRTPMNAIIGLTHLLQRDSREPAQRERLGRVADAAQHLLAVINDILDLSKIESGKLTLEAIDFDLDAMLGRTCALVADRAHEKGLELVLDTDHLPRRLRGDPTRLSQALLNLLGNAVKFTERGSITLRALLLDAGAADSGLPVRFEVQDTGIGIAADGLEHLFQAFEQADGSTTRSHGGTGLGLAITRHLAQMMGGDAGVDSTPGVGSRFWFTARLAAAEPAAAPQCLALPAGLRGLLVDDLPEAREVLGRMLRQLGLRVDAAESGAEALALAEAATAAGDPYGIVLLDWQMPRLDGLETARRLRQQAGDAAPHCVLVSAHDDEQLREQARAAGVPAFLAKPVSLSTLHDTLVQTLAGTLPAAPAGVPAGAAETRLRTAHRGARVLLAEDNLVNQEVAVELLRSAGLTVDVAADGVQAVEMAGRQAYDVILMDMQMPRLDGLQATRALRALPGGERLVVLAMTANAFGEDRAACLAAGMNDHIAKPVDPRALYETLLRWLPAAQPAPVSPPIVVAAPAGGAVTGLGLDGIDGLDTAGALGLLGGYGDLYLRILRMFVEQYADGLPGADADLDGLPAAEAAGRLSRAAHSLRGVSASIGATQIQAQAETVETLGRDRPDDPHLPRAVRALQEALRDLVALLRRRLDPAAAVPSGAGGASGVRPAGMAGAASDGAAAA